MSFQFGGGEQTAGFGSGGEFLQAFVDDLQTRILEIPENLSIALGNIDFETDVEQALSDLNFAVAFDNLSFIPELFSAAELAIQALNTQVEEATETARRLGLEEAKITDARDKALAGFKAGFDEDIQARILRIVSPKQADLNNLDKIFQQIRRDAFTNNADMLAVEELFQLERQKILETGTANALDTLKQTASELSNTLASVQSFNRSILLSDVGGLSKEARRTEALSQFRGAKSRFEAGTGTFAEVAEAGRGLLDASKDFFSFTEAFFADQQEVLGFTRSIEIDTKAQLSGVEKQISLQEKSNNLLTDISNNISLLGANDNNVAALTVGRNDPRLLRTGETTTDLAEKFNKLNNLSQTLVRAAKVQASGGAFDFGTATQSFADFVRGTGGAAVGEEFNRLIASLGGNVQNFATGGISNGGAMITGESGRELSIAPQGTRIFSASDTRKLLNNDNSDVVRAVDRMTETLNQYRKQDSNQTQAMVARLDNMASEIEQLRADARVASG